MITLLLLLMFCQPALAGELPAPPALATEPVEELAYFRTIQRNFNNLVVVTSNPNGSRRGEQGDMILYNNAGSWKDCYNIDGSTAWRCGANALTAP